MSKEEIFTVKTGLGAAHGDTLVNRTQKIYYPWEPTEFGCPQQTSDNSGWTFPGGVHYNSALSQAETNPHGDRSVNCYGTGYPGNASKGQIDSKYAIFHGDKTNIGSRTNQGSNPGVNLRDQNNQIVGYHVVRFDGYMNKQDCNICYINYSTTVGTMLPVYGLTMDFTVCKGATTVKADGSNESHSASNSDYVKDIQINQVHGLWAELPGGISWKAMKLLPNGDNWGGMSSSSDPANGKYVFYDSQDMASSGERRLLGDNGQSNGYIDYNDSGGDVPYTLKLLMNPNESPPSGFAFMGFTMCVAIGTKSNIARNKFFIVNNVNVIDKVNAEKMRDRPEYHGATDKAKTDGLTDVIVPKPQLMDGIIGSRVELYGPRRSW